MIHGSRTQVSPRCRGNAGDSSPNAEGESCRASRHTLDPFVGSLNQEE